MNKKIEMSALLDFYGELLTPKQRDVMELYCYQDLTITEIAQHENITRQGVHISIKRSEKILSEFEEKLHLVRRFLQLSDALGDIVRTASELVTDNEKIKSSIEHIKETAQKAKEII